jgi:hypothetical protein
LSLVREQDTDEDRPIAGEFNGEFNGGEKSQTNGFEHTIESSILTDLIFRKSDVECSEETSSDQRRSPAQLMRFKIRTDKTIASAVT